MLAYFTTSFLKLPRPIYFFSTSFTPMGFLLDSLGFLESITTSLPLVTIRAYWPLSQPIEFTNSFPGLPQPIYFLFTSYYSHRLTTSFIRLPQPIFFFFSFFFFCGLVRHQSCHFSLLGLFSYSFIIFSFSPSLLLGFFAVGPFVKNGHQQLSNTITNSHIQFQFTITLNQKNKKQKTKNTTIINDRFTNVIIV